MSRAISITFLVWVRGVTHGTVNETYDNIIEGNDAIVYANARDTCLSAQMTGLQSWMAGVLPDH